MPITESRTRPRQTEASAPAPQEAPKRASSPATPTVLVVEDDEIVRRVTRMILEDFGYRVLAAEDGPLAMRLSQGYGGQIDLLLSDLIMPGGNGIEWARKLRRYRPSMSVLYMSGYTHEGLRREGVPDPGVRFLKKPFTPDTLDRKIREILDR